MRKPYLTYVQQIRKLCHDKGIDKNMHMIDFLTGRQTDVIALPSVKKNI